MIFNLVLSGVYLLLEAIFGLLPVVSLASIPYIGVSLRGDVVWMVGVWNSFMQTFPYAQIAWQVFLYVVVPFELLLLVAKFFLGHRLPAHTAN